MTRRHADYVYRDARDTLRVRVHRRESGRWDYDVFYPSGTVTTYSDEAGDDFATKRDAIAAAQRQHGPLRAIAAEGSVTPATWHRGVHSTRKKTGALLDRQIGEILARSSGGRVAIPDPPPSVRTDRQRANWYSRKFKAAQEHAVAVARDHGVDSIAYRNADAVSDAFQREWEWYSGLSQQED